MTMTSRSLKLDNDPITQKLAILEHTYPRWRIQQRRGMWTATRVIPPTPTQAAAGLHQFVVQPSLEALAAVLCQQLYIAQTLK